MLGAQFVGLLCGDASARLVTARTDLADQSQVGRIRVQCLADEFVGHVGPVELCGVDVVDAKVDGPAEDGERFIMVARRAEDTGTGELHGAVADAADMERAQREGLHS